MDLESGMGDKKSLELQSEPAAFEMGMKSPSIFELWGDMGMRKSGIRASRPGPPPRVPTKDLPPPPKVQLSEQSVERDVRRSKSVMARMSLKRSTSIAQREDGLGFRKSMLKRPASTSGWVRNPELRSPGMPKVSSLTGLP